jgi:hypothetical protein
MNLKARYLAGEAVDKDKFRRLAVAGEAEMATGDISGMTPESGAIIPKLPVTKWREARKRNFVVLSSQLEQLSWLRVLRPEAAECAPFSVGVELGSSMQRDRLKAHLIERRIFPSILWSLEDALQPVPEQAKELSLRMLSLHCDFRYGKSDLLRVAECVRGCEPG